MKYNIFYSVTMSKNETINQVMQRRKITGRQNKNLKTSSIYIKIARFLVWYTKLIKWYLKVLIFELIIKLRK